MPVLPSFSEFEAATSRGDLVPVYLTILGDLLTPVGALSRLRMQGHAFLLESVIGGEKIGRYSFLSAGPIVRLEARGNHVTQHAGGSVTEWESEDPLADLQHVLDGFKAVAFPELPRFVGGAVGFAGYDTVRYCEKLPNSPPDDRHLPDLSFAIYDRMVIFDHLRKTVLLVVHADLREFASTREAYEDASSKIEDLRLLLSQPETDLATQPIDLVGPFDLPYTSNFTREQFEHAVEKAREYIRAGDIFQVVFSQRLELETDATPLQIYRALRVVNPSPFMFLLESPDFSLVGSSPEIMVRADNGEITIRPLAGTRRRGKTEDEDRRLEEELLADEKERAEHVMLVDLARNDVGRVAQFGSVVLDSVMRVERYSHVMHITSNVTGQLTPGRTALDALRSGLPAGTVSGAPKVRAMQIIDELEPQRRGPYAGAVGYVDFTGNMDTCIALRTLVMQGRKAYIQAGAGIVADSVPSAEYEETLNKARGLLTAIAVAQQQLTTP